MRKGAQAARHHPQDLPSMGPARCGKSAGDRRSTDCRAWRTAQSGTAGDASCGLVHRSRKAKRRGGLYVFVDIVHGLDHALNWREAQSGSRSAGGTPCAGGRGASGGFRGTVGRSARTDARWQESRSGGAAGALQGLPGSGAARRGALHPAGPAKAGMWAPSSALRAGGGPSLPRRPAGTLQAARPIAAAATATAAVAGRRNPSPPCLPHPLRSRLPVTKAGRYKPSPGRPGPIRCAAGMDKLFATLN